jgi:hypothetical protein
MALRHIAAVLACLGAASGAASPLLMPEETRELSVGLGLGNSEEDDRSGRRETYLQPYFDARWSNGVFLEGLWLGMREHSPAPGGDTRLMPMFGAFMHYRLLHNLHLTADGFRMVGSRGGSQMNLGLATYHSMAPHHTLVLAAGLRLSDRRFLQANLDAGPDAQAGVQDSHIEGRWRWEINPKYTASATIVARRLHGDAASARPATRSVSLGYALMLVRRF